MKCARSAPDPRASRPKTNQVLLARVSRRSSRDCPQLRSRPVVPVRRAGRRSSRTRVPRCKGTPHSDIAHIASITSSRSVSAVDTGTASVQTSTPRTDSMSHAPRREERGTGYGHTISPSAGSSGCPVHDPSSTTTPSAVRTRSIQHTAPMSFSTCGAIAARKAARPSTHPVRSRRRCRTSRPLSTPVHVGLHAVDAQPPRHVPLRRGLGWNRKVGRSEGSWVLRREPPQPASLDRGHGVPR